MRKMNQIFLKGLIVVLPVTLTFYLLYWASVKIESLFKSGLLFILGKELYIPGLGIVVTFIFVFLVGLLVNNYITGRILNWFTSVLERVPLIKAIYNPLKDLMGLIPGGKAKDKPQRVVLVPLPGLGVQALGLVTREELDELPNRNLVSVFIPLSYMLGGITVLIERDKVEKIDMKVDQALKLSVTAWIKAEGQDRS
ncbi:MAG TPA: DUF502 domain-containing protein [Bacteriovoracaceae bacterium]|nr:DUF502 domain-containing protein [Bacteriovoracaceae bacterium]